MTLDRDFERIASAWLADGPTELSDRVIDVVVDQIHLTRQRRAMRVPWRFPTMTMPARVAALIAVGALAIAGAIALSGIGGLSRSTPTPSATTQPSGNGAVPIPPLTQTFQSPRNGYSVKYPDTWTATPATAVWQMGKGVAWGDAAMDSLTGTTARLSVASQRVPAGQVGTPPISDIDWMTAYCMTGAPVGTTQADCASRVATWPVIKFGLFNGRVDLDGQPAPSGTIGMIGESRIFACSSADAPMRSGWTGTSTGRSSRRLSARSG
jgi:hypothetical protein